MSKERETMDTEPIPCPFVYSKGKRCSGHLVKVKAYKADLEWTPGADGAWSLSIGSPRSHYHLFCSKKDNHAGAVRPDALKFHWAELPEELRSKLIEARLIA
jgi:hypothetical protein